MDIELSTEAIAFGRESRRAIQAAGGDELALSAEERPGERESLVAPVLRELGAWDLEPRKDPDELEAAAVLCRSAGYWALPYPVAERLARPTDLDVDGLLVIGEHPVGVVSDLELRWAAVTFGGSRSNAVVRPTRTPPRDSGFVAPVELSALDENGGKDLALALVLPCWTLLGMLDRAMDLARSHVLVREQFGQQLARFQGVQFQLTDAEVERGGLDILARHTLWSVQAGRDEAVADALALRLAALEAAEVVFRVAHQVHGALGFCDEATLSWISRCSLPIRRLPWGRSATEALLTEHIGTRGLTGLYSEPGEG